MDERHALARQKGRDYGRTYGDFCATQVLGGRVPTEAEEDAIAKRFGDMVVEARAGFAAAGISPEQIGTWTAAAFEGFVWRLQEIMAQLRAANDAH